MQFYVDSANVEEIRTAHGWGMVSGVTTNPSLVAKEKGETFHARIKEICDIVQGPVSAEVTATTKDAMIKEGKTLAAIDPHVVVKLPLTKDGLSACRYLTDEHGIHVNVTLIFNSNQALLAARAGATYVSPFIGRLDDIGEDGIGALRDVVQVLEVAELDAQVIAASIRHPQHVKEAALTGAHIGTMPFKVIEQLFAHPLTDKGLEKFLSDWSKMQGA